MITVEYKPQIPVDIDPGEPSNIKALAAADVTHGSLQSVWLNDLAP